jgi:hypothetical protein
MLVQTRISVHAAAQPQDRAGEVFILDGKKPCWVRGIVVDENAHVVEKAAAKELQAYIAKMSGAQIPILESGAKRPFDRGVIYVGKSKAAQDGFLFFAKFYADEEFERLGYDGFILRSQGGNLLIAGKNYRGTVYGVYRLLEKLGCKFYARELEMIPKVPVVESDVTAVGFENWRLARVHSTIRERKLEIPGPFNITDGAAFEWRAMSGTIAPMKCGLSPGDAEARVGETVVPRMMGIPPKGWFWHHTMGFLLPAKELAESHPEYLAQIDGERRVVEAAVQQYCLSNPELLRRMTEAVLDWVAKDPDRVYYPVHFGDVVKFCECDKCKAFYAERGSVSDVVIWFDNQIAKAVAEKFPGKFVTILAYHSTRSAPKKVRPEPNLLIIFCAIRECQGRPWSAPINMKLNVCKDLEDWIADHPLGGKGIISFDYPTTYHFAGFPYPALYAYVDNIRYYKKLGLRGEYVCGLGGWKHLEHLYSYVMPRIMWNPDQDMGALIDEFCQAWYGAAWKPMREYVEMLHRGAMESKSEGVMDCHAGPGQKFFRELYTREFLDKAYGLFKNAESLAEDDFVRRRIQKEKWGLLFVDLFLYGQKGADLVPAPTEPGIERKTASLEDYRKMAEFLQINRLFNRPWNMEPRRKFTLSSIIGFEPTREPWWTCPRVSELMENPAASYEKQARIGEEIGRNFVSLDNEHLKVTIIPRLGGRIWRLYHKDTRQDLLWRGTIPLSVLEHGLAADQYVNLGGYEEYTGEKFGSPGWAEAYECKPSSDGKSATLSKSLPNGLRLTRTVSLAAEGRGIEIDSVLENTSGQTVKEAILRAHPEFALKPEEGGVEIGVKQEDGNFVKFSLTKGETFLSAKQLPRGEWSARFPKTGLRILNEFDLGQVGTCLLYVGPEFFNLELFSPKKSLAPGEKIRIRHRYVITQTKP